MTTGSNSASPFSKSWPTTIGKSNGWRARPLSRPNPPEAGIHGIDPVAAEERNRLGLGDDPVLELRKLLEADVGFAHLRPGSARRDCRPLHQQPRSRFLRCHERQLLHGWAVEHDEPAERVSDVLHRIERRASFVPPRNDLHRRWWPEIGR